MNAQLHGASSLVDSSGASTPVQRERLLREGYIYLPGLLPAEAASAVAAEAQNALDSYEKETGVSLVQFDVSAYQRVQALESFHELASSPELRHLVENISGMTLFRHPAAVLRLGYPSTASTVTRAHQDFLVQQLSADIFTCWIALTPSTDHSQGLLLLPGSHRKGLIAPDRGAGGARPLYIGSNLPLDSDTWSTSRYNPGDVVVFSNLLVHAGGPNTSRAIRMSIDTRFQPLSDPILEEHTHPHGWPELADWPILVHNWKRLSAPTVPSVVRVEPPLLHGVADSLASVQVPPSHFWK